MSEDMPRDWERLAREVRVARVARGLGSQKDAAEAAGVSINTWSRLENGHPASRETLDAVAAVLGWPPGRPDAILVGHSDPGERRRPRPWPPRMRGQARWFNPPDFPQPEWDLSRRQVERPPTDAYLQEHPELPEWTFLSVVVPIPVKLAGYLSPDDVVHIQSTARDHARALASSIARTSRDRAARLLEREVWARHDDGEPDREIASKIGMPLSYVLDILHGHQPGEDGGDSGEQREQ